MQRFLPISPGHHERIHQILEFAQEFAAAGGRMILLRELHMSATALEQLVEALLPVLPEIQVHDRTQGARELARTGRVGLHLSAAVDPALVRAEVPGRLGVSAHSRRALLAAEEAGADYALLSPVYKPGSKPLDVRSLLGAWKASRAWSGVEIPVFALGGMTPPRMRTCRRRGAYGAAGITGVFESPEGPQAALRAFLAVE